MLSLDSGDGREAEEEPPGVTLNVGSSPVDRQPGPFCLAFVKVARHPFEVLGDDEGSNVAIGIYAVAFPALSTGAFGYPMEEAAEVALSAVVERTPYLTSVRRIRFVLRGRRALEIHGRILRELNRP